MNEQSTTSGSSQSNNENSKSSSQLKVPLKKTPQLQELCYEEAQNSLKCQTEFSDDLSKCSNLIEIYKSCRSEKVFFFEKMLHSYKWTLHPFFF